MNYTVSTSFLLIGLLCSILSFSYCESDASFVNSKVERQVDVASQLVKVSTSVTVENPGNDALRKYVFGADPNLANFIAFVGVTVKSSDDESVSLEVEEIRSELRSYRVTLEEPLAAGSSVTLKIDEVYIHALRNYPAEITQSQKQFVELLANGYFYSPYTTTTQTTTVKLASKTVESYTKLNPVSADDDTITYGPYSDITSYSKADIKIHYENNSPFLSITSLTRVIEISHWGNIAVEETLDLAHKGAKLKGPFSRYDYQRMQDGFSSVKSFKTILPASAQDVYYRDEIGNISTSNLLEKDDHVELEIRPRFPLFGGWKTHYYIGYNLPSYEYLYNAGDDYVLKMRLLDHVFDDMIVESMEVRIILPEGCKNIEFKAPYDVKRLEDEVHKTYLDTVGRSVVVIQKSKLVEQHIEDFELHYTFQKILLLQEPFLIVGAFFIIFLCIIIIVRLDFSITQDEANESRLRLTGLVEQVLSLQNKRQRLYPSYDAAINKFKSSKDNSTFRSTLKKLDAEHRSITTSLGELAANVKQESGEVSEKIQKLQKLTSTVKEMITTAITNADKVVAGKFSKQQYVDYEKMYMTRRNEVISEIDALTASL